MSGPYRHSLAHPPPALPGAGRGGGSRRRAGAGAPGRLRMAARGGIPEPGAQRRARICSPRAPPRPGGRHRRLVRSRGAGPGGRCQPTAGNHRRRTAPPRGRGRPGQTGRTPLPLTPRRRGATADGGGHRRALGRGSDRVAATQHTGASGPRAVRAAGPPSAVRSSRPHGTGGGAAHREHPARRRAPAWEQMWANRRDHGRPWRERAQRARLPPVALAGGGRAPAAHAGGREALDQARQEGGPSQTAAPSRPHGGGRRRTPARRQGLVVRPSPSHPHEAAERPPRMRGAGGAGPGPPRGRAAAQPHGPAGPTEGGGAAPRRAGRARSSGRARRTPTRPPAGSQWYHPLPDVLQPRAGAPVVGVPDAGRGLRGPGSRCDGRRLRPGGAHMNRSPPCRLAPPIAHEHQTMETEGGKGVA